MAKISGNISDNARLIIVKEADWTVESNTTETGGAFEIDNLTSGKKTIISRSAIGECEGYGNVTAIEPAAPDPILHTARFFGSDDDGYLVGWASSFSSARSLSTAGEINTNYDHWNEAIRASKTGFGGVYEYMVARSFFEFNLSGFSLTGRTLQDVKLEIRSDGNAADSAVVIQESNHSTPLAMEDFDAFTGSAIAGPVTWALFEADDATKKKNTFTFNSTGKNYVSGKVGTGVAKFCARENHHDYDGNNTTTENRNGVCFNEYGPDLDWTANKYINFSPMLVLEYMKIPVWTSYFNQDYWEPFDENSDNATWNGTGWAAGRWGSLDIQVKTGTTWHSNYKPLKIKITFTGTSSFELYFYSNTHWSFMLVDMNGNGPIITSGQELEIDWHYPNDHIFEIYVDDPNVVITNIEFLER
jgi:hypothetical protein